MIYDSGNANYLRLQKPHAGRLTDSIKHEKLPSSFDIHPCQYDADLGSDSDQCSQTSSEGFSSQDSHLGTQSPASTSSDEYGVDWHQQARISQPNVPASPEACDSVQQRTSTKFAIPANLDSSNGSRHCRRQEVPFRPKPVHPASNINQDINLSSSLSRNDTSGSGQNCASSTSAFQCRRRGRSIGPAGTPPTLRRDTDHTDAIVRMIVLFCTNLINSIWCTSAVNGVETTTNQSGSNVLPLQIFITETLRRSKTSYSTLQIALYYLILLKQCLPSFASAGQSGQANCRAMQCGRRMFLTSLILASKYLQDRNYSARAWSKISGLPLKEINDNERRFLSIVCWDLHVPKATFENWSKIVLNVCRRSMDPDVGCKGGLDRYPPGSGSGPNAQRQCALSNMCKDVDALRSWWMVNLQKLRTDIVKCGVQTTKYVESISPFRDGTYLPRPVSTNSFEDDYAQPFLGQDSKHLSEDSRAPSLERSTKCFEPVHDLLHPAPPTVIPPQPTLRNLPTPQTTPQADLSGWWTPKLANQTSKPSLRCRASASALGNAFRRHCPIANLETCPPPQPRSCSQAQRLVNAAEATPLSHTSAVSLTSSPESIVSDYSSIAPRSRSSSISSTSSWNTSSSQSSGRFSLKEEHQNLVQQLNSTQPLPNPVYVQQLCHSRQHSLPRRSAPPMPQSIERPQTAFKVPNEIEHNNFARQTSLSESGPADRFVDEGYVSDEHAKRRQEAAKQEAAQVLAGLYIDETATRSRARPTLTRCRTQISDPRSSQERCVPKRNRSDSSETSQNVSSTVYGGRVDSWTNNGQTLDTDHNREGLTVPKDIQHPTQHWAAPRRPLQFGTQNKRLALQMPANSAAAELAGQYLKLEMQSNRLGPICH